MRRVVIPATIGLVNPLTKERLPDAQWVSFHDYAYNTWFNHPSVQGAAAIARWGNNVVAKFDKASPGQGVLLEDADWQRLKEVVEAATNFYLPLIEYQLLPYREAVLGAATHDPSIDVLAAMVATPEAG
jgi:hypothetical protein